MADSYKQTLDVTEWDHVFDKLGGVVKESLSRRMLVEGGVLLRDEAKMRVPVSKGPYTDTSRGSHSPGSLRNAIYLAYDTDVSRGNIFQYKVTWNDKKAFWGKFIEFGYWRTHVINRGADGKWYTRKDLPLAQPIWVPARPFLRPTLDAKGNAAIRVMIQRGKQELPILLAEIKQ